MNIKNIQNIAKIYGEQSKVNKNCKSPGSSSAQRPDEVILSTHAQEMSQILRTAKGLPEVREDKVNLFSEQIAKGDAGVGNDIVGKPAAQRPAQDSPETLPGDHQAGFVAQLVVPALRLVAVEPFVNDFLGLFSQ